MIIESLKQKLEDTGIVSSSRQEVGPDVITKNPTHKSVLIPEKFEADIVALERYTATQLKAGICITVSLSDLLSICPRERKRSDAYYSLVKYLKEELDVELIIKSQKSKKA